MTFLIGIKLTNIVKYIKKKNQGLQAEIELCSLGAAWVGNLVRCNWN